jgi:hypothetical protein
VRKYKKVLAAGDPKTLSPELKPAVRPLSDSRFCLWQNLKNLNQKMTENLPKPEQCILMVSFGNAVRTYFNNNTK